MILANINGEKGVVQVAVKGSVRDISMELSLLIHDIYISIAKEDKESADVLKLLMQSVIKEDFLFMEDLAEAVKEIESARINNFEEMAKELMK